MFGSCFKAAGGASETRAVEMTLIAHVCSGKHARLVVKTLDNFPAAEIFPVPFFFISELLVTRVR